MSSVKAITQDLVFTARIATFTDFSNADKSKLLEEMSRRLHDQGKQLEFLVWRTSLEVKDTP
jgi:hypothetical protein